LKRFFLPGVLALAALCFHEIPALAQHIETSTFNQAPARPPEDPAVVERGKAAYEKYCQQCHSADMRGTETYPNLLRSQDALIDKHGEELVPIMRGESADFPGHKTDIDTEDAQAVAAYIRSMLALIGSGLLLAARFLLLAPAIAAGETEPVLKRAWALSAGNFWRLLGVLLALFLPLFLFSVFLELGLAQKSAAIAGATQQLQVIAAMMQARQILPLTCGLSFFFAPVVIGLYCGASVSAWRAVKDEPAVDIAV